MGADLRHPDPEDPGRARRRTGNPVRAEGAVDQLPAHGFCLSGDGEIDAERGNGLGGSIAIPIDDRAGMSRQRDTAGANSEAVVLNCGGQR